MRVALVHDFLKEYGGAERFLEVLSDLFPDAPIFTAFYLPQSMHRRFETRDVRVHAIQRLPLLSLLSKQYTFLYPIVFESFNLDEFDVVISSSASFAKGVITKPSTLHISYIHTPPRFLYHYPSEVSRREKWYYKPFLYPLDHLLRMWDFLAAQRPDVLVSYYAHCEALIFPVEEDFGLVPIECMSQGKPVLALKKGGALETVKEKETGLFFQEATVAEISSAIRRFSYTTFSESTIRTHAQAYSRKSFEEKFLSFVETSWETYQ